MSNNKKRRQNSLIEDAKKASRGDQAILVGVLNLFRLKPTSNPKEAYIRVYWYLTDAIMVGEPDLSDPSEHQI